MKFQKLKNAHPKDNSSGQYFSTFIVNPSRFLNMVEVCYVVFWLDLTMRHESDFTLHRNALEGLPFDDTDIWFTFGLYLFVPSF